MTPKDRHTDKQTETYFTVVVDAKTIELAAKTYSADSIGNHSGKSRIHGIFEHSGKMWVCVSCAGRDGRQRVDLVEILPNSGPNLTSEWVSRGMGPTVKYAQACAQLDSGERQRSQLYAGIAVTFRGQEYVLGYERLVLTLAEIRKPRRMRFGLAAWERGWSSRCRPAHHHNAPAHQPPPPTLTSRLRAWAFQAPNVPPTGNP